MDESYDTTDWTPEDWVLHEKGLALVALFEQWATSNPDFIAWMKQGLAELNAGEYSTETVPEP